MLIKRIVILCYALFIVSCTGIPDGVKPIDNFNLEKYQGTWYEIARLDHSFERDLENVSAQYRIKTDGNVEVINQGFLPKDKIWKKAIGNAKFVQSSDKGYLKVSFFGPFYGSYIIFELDEHYQHAFVSGPDLSYLWLLSRTKTIEPELMNHFIEKAKTLGFDTENLILVNQDSNR
jgi:apolipoprotein D and lipocalin family protein